MPLGTGRTAGQTITAADINGIATEVNLKIDGSAVVAATVAASEGTTSLFYANLATVGPAVTATIGSSGKALVAVGGWMFNTTGGAYGIMSFEVSGASTLAADDARSIAVRVGSGSTELNAGRVYLVSGLTAGSNTFTAKYRAAVGGTATFIHRHIVVVPL